MQDVIITQGITIEELLSKMGTMVDGKIKEAIEAVHPKESPDDLLTYHEILRIYNMKSYDYVSNRVSKAKIEQQLKDGAVAIRRADAELLFRKKRA